MGNSEHHANRLRRGDGLLIELLESRRLLTADYLNAITIGCDQFDASKDIAVDARGNVYVIGTFRSEMDFDPRDNFSKTLVPTGDSSVFVAKYDPKGALVWVNGVPNLNGNGNQAGGIVVDRFGDVYIAGNVYGSGDFGYGAATGGFPTPEKSLNRTANHHPFVAKIFGSGSSQGKFAWVQAADGGAQSYLGLAPDDPHNRARAIALDSSGNVCVAGNFIGAVDFNPATAGGEASSAAGSSDGFLWRVKSSDGAFVSINRFGGNGAENARGIAVDTGGNSYLTGSFSQSFSFGPRLLSNKGQDDGFVVKFSGGSSPTPMDGASFSGASFPSSNGANIDRGESVAIDSSGGFWVVGFADGIRSTLNGIPSLSNEQAVVFHYTVTLTRDFATSFGSPTGRDSCVDVAVDSGNNAYLTGYFSNTVNFDPRNGANPRSKLAAPGPAGKVDVFILKLTARGEFVWVRQLGGISPDFASAIALDASVSGSPNVYTTGIFTGTANFDPQKKTPAAVRSANGVVDTFISKLSQAKPDFYSATQIGGAGSDSVKAVASDAAGDAYVLGTFTGTVDFDPTSATVNKTAAVAGAVYIAKYLPYGKLAWVQALPSTLTSLSGASIAVDAAGNADIAFTSPRSGVAGDTALTVARFNSSGVQAFSKTFNAAAASSVAGDASGNVIVAGSFHGTVDFDPGTGTKNLTASTKAAFVLKLNSSGAFLWADQFGGAAGTAVEINTVALTTAGDVYAAGDWNGTVDFDPSLTAASNQSGTNDAFIVKLTTGTGTLVPNSFKKLFGAGNSSITAIALDSSNNLYATGSFSGTCDFNPDAVVTANLASEGSTDAFLLKLSSSATYQFAKRVGGTRGDVGTSIALDPLNNVSLLGNFASTQVHVSGSTTTYAGSGTLLFRFASKDGSVLTPPIKTLLDTSGVAAGGGGSFIYLVATYSGTDPTSGLLSHGADGLLTKFIV